MSDWPDSNKTVSGTPGANQFMSVPDTSRSTTSRKLQLYAFWRIREVQMNINQIALALEVHNLQERLIQHAEVLNTAYPQGKGE